LQRWLLQRVDAFVCLRSAEMTTLSARFGIERDRCRFVYFPPAFERGEIPREERAAPKKGEYLYASGSAHRDWDTLLDALRMIDYDAVVSADLTPDQARRAGPRTVLLPHASPEDGRALASSATAVIVPLKQTEQPAGPTVLVDAMALGRPVIATDTSGTRDYVIHGVTGWLVPPANAEALAASIEAALADPALLRAVGNRAERAAWERFSATQFAEAVADACQVP
jgi:glycosyltransferase involved in cell wall biosynthesis